MERLKTSFPEGVVYSIPFNPTEFVDESIHEVYKTLFEAGVLVLVVIMVFLQDWRAVLIPATTVPVTIIGAFAAMKALGFTINMLTLFGLVLAIGIVVDDAIVIVENAVHHIDRGRLDPKSATIKAMSEVIGPVIGITLVLMAVFLPTAFLPGITGQLYRQFALTIAATALISAINAVTLKPAQCAMYLRRHPRGGICLPGVQRRVRPLRGRLCSLVRRGPSDVRDDDPLRRSGRRNWLVVQPAAERVHAAQGPRLCHRGVQLPDAASQVRTRAVVDQLNKILANTPGIANWFMIGGNSILDQAAASQRRSVSASPSPPGRSEPASPA